MTLPATGPVHDTTHLDWITVTHDDGEALRWFLRGPTEVLPKGVSTYKRVEQDGFGTKLCSMGPEPRPFMLIMSGQSLAAWRAEDDDQGLIYTLAFDDAHCTRLDLARNTAGPWTPYLLRSYLEQDRFISKWRGIRYTSSKGGEALTVQLGSRQSSAMLRVYDKRAEMLAKGEPCPFPRLSRWELEIKGDLAPVALRQLANCASIRDDDTGELRWPMERVHSAWLAQRLTLTSQPVDRANKNQARAEPDPEWVSFLGIPEDVKLVPDLDERGPHALAQDLGRWAVRALAPTLATLVDLGGAGTIGALLNHGRTRKSTKHRMLLDNLDEARDGLWAGIDA